MKEEMKKSEKLFQIQADPCNLKGVVQILHIPIGACGVASQESCERRELKRREGKGS